MRKKIMQLKGNLHTHTKRSDGNLEYGSVLELYESRGYDFLAVTDHYIYNPSSKYKNMTVISGVEYHTGKTVQEGIWHIVALGMTKDPRLTNIPDLPSLETIIGSIRKCGATVNLAHPAWSLERVSEIIKARKLGIDCTEMYNSVSGIPFNNRGCSDKIIDALAVEGWYVPILGVDDAHFYSGDECKTFTVVDAPNRSEEAILKAIREGKSYASQGPEFSIEIGRDKLYVECTPVERICFNTDTPYACDRVHIASNMKGAVYEIKPNDTYVRIDMVDKDGNFAWSRALPIKS